LDLCGLVCNLLLDLYFCQEMREMLAVICKTWTYKLLWIVLGIKMFCYRFILENNNETAVFSFWQTFP